MTLTRLIYSKEASRQANLQSQAAPSSEADEILHLKRLLVTLKQHYEKSLHSSQIQLQVEQSQKVALQTELNIAQSQLRDCQQMHEEELQALRNQQTSLKDLLKTTQEELAENKDQAQRELTLLRRSLEAQKDNICLETVVSTTSSHHLRQELEGIKRTLAQEAKSLENRYVEILNDKISLEHHCKQLQLQLEHQSSNLVSFQAQLHEIEAQNKVLEDALRTNELKLAESSQRIEEMQKRIGDLGAEVSEKDFIQDKYEQLKDEWNQIGERLEESEEARAQAELYLTNLQEASSKQEEQINSFTQELQIVQEERKNLEAERDQIKISLDEGETRLKVAQQHLAKKVKESALLNERVDEQQNNLTEMAQTLEQQKTQIVQLQANVDLYQRQEKRLQEQLHDALKGTESQVAKWEEKYFRMYDKWQDTENKIRELKKFEEKHHQMQHLLANLGNFMGGSFIPATGAPQSVQEPIERNPRSPSFEELQTESSPPANLEADQRYDLFGMSQHRQNPSP